MSGSKAVETQYLKMEKLMSETQVETQYLEGEK